MNGIKPSWYDLGMAKKKPMGATHRLLPPLLLHQGDFPIHHLNDIITLPKMKRKFLINFEDSITYFLNWRFF
ncbi:MAG: hypothetical protein DSY46_01215 [Hydrogenimonas sp.]|nr:MAG: hypothetical protein DSY46_01215 [Hydrogenimonas sp.]